MLALLYGGAMFVNFAWPRAASNPTPNQTLGSLSLGLHFLNKIPILYTVLGVILIIGIIYYSISEVRKPLPVHVPAESGPVEIPPETLPPEDLCSARVGRSVLTGTVVRQVEAPDHHSGTVAPEQVPGELDRPAVGVESDSLDEQQRRATGDTEELGGMVVRPDRLQGLDSPAGTDERIARSS